MARFIGASKGLGFLKYLEIERKTRKNPFENLQVKNHEDEEILKSEVVIGNHERIVSEKFDTYQVEEDKKFWMNLMKPSKKEVDIIKSIKFKLKIVETLVAIVSLISLIFTQFEYELEYSPKKIFLCDKIEPCDYKGNAVRLIVSVMCFCLAVMTIYVSYLSYTMKKEQKKIINTAFYRSYYFKRMIFELLIDLIHPIPYFEYKFSGVLLGQFMEYQIQTLFYSLMFLKLYSVIRILAAYTSYSNNMSERYCEMFGSEADTAFALKAVQKDWPFFILTMNFLIFCVILGILLRMFEILDKNNGENYKFYTNGIWNIIVIMTTVGYGEYFPKTHIGRFVAVLSIVLGTLLMALTIVALNGITEFQHNEKRAFTILHRIELRKSLHDTCQGIIKYNLQLYKLRKTHNFHYKTLLDMVTYNAIIRKLKYLGNRKLFLKRELSRESFARDEDKFLSLNHDVEDEIYLINMNIKLIEENIVKFKIQLKHQESLIKNLENSLLLFRNCIKPAYYKLFAQNSNFVMADQTVIANIDNSFMTTMNGNVNKNNLKEVAMRQIEYLLFYGPPKIIAGSASKDPVITLKHRRTLIKVKNDYEDFINPTNAPNIVIKNMLTKKVIETFQMYREKYSKNLDESIHSVQNEKDPVRVEYEKIQKLDPKTRQLFTNTSKKTLDLLTSMNNIKIRNNLIFGKGSSKDFELPAAPDIFANLIDEDDYHMEKEDFREEKPLDKTVSSDVGRPLLKKLKSKMASNQTYNNANNNNGKNIPTLNNEELHSDEKIVNINNNPNVSNITSLINESPNGRESQKKSTIKAQNQELSPEIIKPEIKKANAQIEITSNDINKSADNKDSSVLVNKRDQPKDNEAELFKSLNDVFAFMNQNPKLNLSPQKGGNAKNAFMGRLKSSKDLKK